MSSHFRFLDVVKPFLPYLPEIAAPERRVPFNQKVLWTAVTLLVFLVMSQVPLYGIVSSDSSDPLYWMRMILASNRGTLMELGISPIVSSSMLIQLLAGSQLIDVNFDLKSDRELHQTAQKLLAMIISFGQATVYVLSGLYGQPKNLGVAVCVLLVAQLVSAGMIVILLDELLQKGYGLGSGISLFIATNICEDILNKALSPATVNFGRGTEFEGAILNFLYSLFAAKNKVQAVIHAFTRKAAPNMSSVVMTLLVFAIVIYLQGFRLELKIQSAKQRGQYGSYPIKLFYTSNMSIMLVSALTSNLFLVSQMLYSRFSNNFLVRLLGSWAPLPGSSQLRADGGLAYYLTPPLNIKEAILDPLHAAIYISFMLGSCAAFSAIWIEVSGGSAREVAKMFKNQQMVLAGYRETSMYKELKRIIPTAAWLSGACIGLLAVSSDLLGALGSGTAVLLCTTIIYGYYEQFVQETNSQLATLGDLFM